MTPTLFTDSRKWLIVPSIKTTSGRLLANVTDF